MGGGASKGPNSGKRSRDDDDDSIVSDEVDHGGARAGEGRGEESSSSKHGGGGGVDMHQLAFGDSAPSWGDQHREYDRTLKDIKKGKPAQVEWTEVESDSHNRTQPRATIAPPKQPPPRLTSPQGSLQGSKMTRPLSTTNKPKPAPPAVSPYATKNSTPNRFSSPSTKSLKRPDSLGHSRREQPQLPPSEQRKERSVDLGASASSGRAVAEPKASRHQENLENILRKMNKQHEADDSDDSDCYDVEEDGDGSVYDWTTSHTNTSNCVSAVPTKDHADAKVDVPAPGSRHPSQQLMHRQSSVHDDDLCAEFSEATVDTYHRPSSVPKLRIPASAMSAPPPLGPHRGGTAGGGGKPAPPRGMPSHMNMKVGIPVNNSSNGFGKTKMTPTPVRKQPIHKQPSPPNSRSNSQVGKKHEVKETKDVKRNRAQMPSALKHVKPTTGDWLKKRYIVNNYIMLDVLGTGSYGEVRMCKERTTDELFGIKILSKEMLKKKKGGNTNETYFEDIKREIAIMKKLEHPNVLRLFEVLDDPNVNKLYLVLEYMKKGDLLHFIKERDKDDKDNKEKSQTKRKNSKAFTPLRDQELWFIFKQVIAGVRYLHYQNIVHGDIKPQNILVSEDGTVKLADFGISKMLENGSSQKLVNAAGTPAFMAPELCEAREAFSGQLADVWAIGATMYMLRFGTPPFVSGNIMALYNKIINDPLEFPAGPLDPGLRNLLVNMLEKDPKLRFTTDQVTTHPWMRIPPGVNDSRKSAYTSSASTPSQKECKSIHFNDDYVKKEAKAMKGPLKTIGDDDIFTSIGFGTIKKDEAEEGEEEEDDDDDEDGDDELLGDNIMTSDWGLDVFEKVDAEDSDSAADSDDDSVDSPKRPEKPKIASKLVHDPKYAEPAAKQFTPTSSSSSSKLLKERSTMDESELDRRSKNFMSKLTKKPSSNIKAFSSSSEDSDDDDVSVDSPKQPKKHKIVSILLAHDSKQVEVSSNASTPKASASNKLMERNAMDQSELDRRSKNFMSKLTKKPSRNMNTCSSSDDSDDYDDDDVAGVVDDVTEPAKKVKPQNEVEEDSAESLSMDDFEKMMDTLAMRPVSKSNSMTSGESTPHEVPLRPRDLEVASEFVNTLNGVAGVYHSEQGSRKGQEDRCFLLISPGKYNKCTAKHSEFSTYINVDNLKISLEEKEHLHAMSVAGVFDGHSGSKCAQYLLERFASLLLSKKGLYNRNKQKQVLLETCREMDTQVCQYLRDLNNFSGSTGVVLLYDGRSRILTVANVGDSMCVLSRGGKAVKIHRTHRVCDEADEVERVKQAGGTVQNKRVNGLLAISRAFGDTQFKSEGDLSGPVIATPDIVSEIITPMTEFAIAATDGLWDVIDPQAAVNFVKRRILKKQNFATIVQDLVDDALDRGSIDNVTAVIVMFHLDKRDNS